MKRQFYYIPLDPMSVVSIAERERILDGYAAKFVDNVEGFDTLEDYARQVAVDMNDRDAAKDLKAKVVMLRRARMRVCR